MFDWILNAPQVKAVRTLNSEINISVAPWSGFYAFKYILCTTQSFADVFKIGVLKIWRPSTLLKRDSITGAFLQYSMSKCVKFCCIHYQIYLIQYIYWVLSNSVPTRTHPHSSQPTAIQPKYFSTHPYPSKIMPHTPPITTTHRQKMSHQPKITHSHSK